MFALHDVGLVNNGDTISADGISIIESITGNTLRSIFGDQLDRLNNTVNNLL
jgi:hypothetical protein